MKLSIALCTFNGEKYLAEQLDSYTQQTRQPDQLVICDDDSIDNTRCMLESFATTAPFEVRIYCNEHRLGSTENFSKAIQLCDGDVIFFSGQDDVWNPLKVERIANAFEEHSDVGAIFTDAEVVSENLQPREHSLWETIHFTPQLQEQIVHGEGKSILVRRNCATGATLAFRGQYKSVIAPIPKGFYEDEWTVLLLAFLDNSVSILPDRLIKYRQHSHNMVGVAWTSQKQTFPTVGTRVLATAFKARNRTRRRSYASAADRFQTVKDRLLQQDLMPCSKESLLLLDDVIAHYQRRAEMHSNRLRRFPQVLAEFLTLRYFHYANGMRTFIKDILEKDYPSQA